LGLVSNENFSETLWPSGWALGQVTWAKMTLKLLHLWRQSQKNPQSPTKKCFFECNLEDCPTGWALEQLSSTIGGGATALVRQLTTAGFRPKLKYEYIAPRLSKC